MHSIGSIYRAEAMFLTNKENMCAETGDWTATQINSSNMLWSLSGSLSIVTTLFGMRFRTDGLHFEPFVPKEMRGERSLKGFRYRNAVLDIEVLGYGNSIESFAIDGKQTDAVVAADTKGRHSIVIRLNNSLPKSEINLAGVVFSPDTPQALLSEGNTLEWDSIEGAELYTVLCNAQAVAQTTDTRYTVDREGEWQVVALDSKGIGSFASEPVEYRSSVRLSTSTASHHNAIAYKGFVGSGYIELSKQKTPNRNSVSIEPDGIYAGTLLANATDQPTRQPLRFARCRSTAALGVCIFSQWGKDPTILATDTR